MKPTIAARSAILAIGALVVLVGPASAAAAPPTIESEWVTSVTEHNAVLHATINPNGTLTQYKLQFDESGTYHFYQPDCGVLHVPGYAYCQHVTPGDERIEPPEGSIPAGGDAVEVSVDLASIGATIEPNTTYHYRAIAANGAPEVEGPDQTFTTPPEAPAGELPEAPITEACSGPIVGSGQRLCGTLNPDSSAKVGYYFEVREGSSCVGGTHFGDLAEVEGQNVPVSTQVHSLAPNTEYTVCLVATNTAGETRGQGLVFMTPAQPPSAEPPTILSQTASNVTEHDATLEAEIDPNERDTVYELQIDTTGNFSFYQTSSCALNVPGVGCTTEVVPGDPLAPGLVQPPEYTLPASDEPQQVSVSMVGIGAVLQPGTTYHYRVVASNGGPEVEGSGQTFTTPSPDSPDPTPPGKPPVGFTAPASLPAVNPAPPVSHPRRSKHRRHRHHRHTRSTRSIRSVRR